MTTSKNDNGITQNKPPKFIITPNTEDELTIIDDFTGYSTGQIAALTKKTDQTIRNWVKALAQADLLSHRASMILESEDTGNLILDERDAQLLVYIAKRRENQSSLEDIFADLEKAKNTDQIDVIAPMTNLITILTDHNEEYTKRALIQAIQGFYVRFIEDLETKNRQLENLLQDQHDGKIRAETKIEILTEQIRDANQQLRDVRQLFQDAQIEYARTEAVAGYKETQLNERIQEALGTITMHQETIKKLQQQLDQQESD